MVIDRIYIDSFGALRAKELTFDAGLNIIEGENECGKTTVAAFIRFIFYGIVDRAEAERYFLFADGGVLSGTLDCTVTAQGGEKIAYRIQRTLHPADAGPNTADIRRLDTGAPVFVGQIPGEVFFGVSAEVFQGTAFVKQVAAGQASDAGTALQGQTMRDSIEHILYAVNESINPPAAIQSLSEKRDDLYHPAAKTGTIYTLEKERSALISRMESVRQNDEEIQTLKRAIADNESRIRMHETRSAELQKLYDQYRLYQTFDDMSVIEDLRLTGISADRRTGTLAAAMFRGEYFPDESYVQALNACAEDMRQAQKERNDAEEALQKLDFSARRDNIKVDYLNRVEYDGGVSVLQNHLRQFRTRRRLMLVCGIVLAVFAVLALAVAGSMLYLHANNVQYGWYSFALLFIGAVVSFASYHKACRKTDHILQRYNCETDDELENFLEEYVISEERFHKDTESKESLRETSISCKLRYDEAAKKAAQLLCQLQPDHTEKITAGNLTPETIDTVSERIGRTLTEILRMQTQAETCRTQIIKYAKDAGLQAETAEEAIQRWEEKRAALRAAFGDKPASALDMEPVFRELDFNFKADQALMKRIQAQKDKLRALGCDPDLPPTAEDMAVDPQVLSNLLAEMDAELRKERRAYAAYNLAIEKLQTASNKLHDAIAPTLTEHAGVLMRTLSDCQYRELQLDEHQKLTCHMTTGDPSAPKTAFSVDYLSAGTQDIAYLSLRMALLPMLYEKEMPPLLFDDAFVSLDDRRLTRMLTLLFHATSGADTAGQALVFTCHKRERSAAEALPASRVITL